MKKRIFALTLALIMTVLAVGLCACNGKSDAKTDWEYIQDKGELVIGITYFAPMNYYDGENLVGFETEFAQAVCAKLGVTAKFQEIIWDNKVSELNSKAIDCIWNGMTVTPQLAENIDFSKSYMSNTQIVVIRKADADKYTSIEALADAKLVAEAGSAGERAVQQNTALATAEYTALSTQANTLVEVKSLQADAAVLDLVAALGMINDDNSYADLMVAPGLYPSTEGEEYAIGLRKDSPQTQAKINAAIKELYDDGTLLEIAEKYGLADRIIAQ